MAVPLFVRLNRVKSKSVSNEINRKANSNLNGDGYRNVFLN